MQSIKSLLVLCFLLLLGSFTATATSAAEKPNILVIWGDDIGYWNISRYSMGMMGYPTPSIDRIASEGMIFTDYYGEQSCTAGRSAFITGQHPVRTGLTKVGIPGSDIGIQAEDPTLAELLKPHGYTSGQFGKNHLGDRDEFLPTNHEEFLAAALKFMDRAHEKQQPFFLWFNSTRMHYYTHVKDESLGLSGQGFYNDGMLEHDGHVGQLLAKLDALGIADDTIVIYSTDNGPHFNQWPDGAITPFRGEKNTNWEGGYRVPAIVRWPGKVAPGSISNAVMSHLDWVPTLLAVVGDDNIAAELKQGKRVGNKNFKVHLDGYNFLPYLTGQSENAPRREFFYFSDDGQLTAARVGDWKLVFAEQRARRFDVWRDPFVTLRIPKVFHLRRDPFERADTDANSYNVWWDKKISAAGSQGMLAVAQFVASLRAFPPRQRPGTFTVDQVMESVYQPRAAQQDAQQE